MPATPNLPSTSKAQPAVLAPDVAIAMIFPTALPPCSGIGLKPEHYLPMLEAFTRDGGVRTNWVEIHPQNYFGAGGPPHRWLTCVAHEVPVSFHSTALSLGSASGPDLFELDQLATLAARYQPAIISDHLSWSNAAGEKFPDLLPVPYTRDALEMFVRNVDIVQTRLRRAILVENPSRYLAFAGDEIDEIGFLHELCARAGCGLLLDINNVEVSAANLGFDADAYLARVDATLVGEIHLAGHATEFFEDGSVLRIDDHGSAVSETCWASYESFIARSGPRPTLIERDTNLPSYDVLMAEAMRADAALALPLLEPGSANIQPF